MTYKVHPHEEIIRKWLEGEKIQFKSLNGEWADMTNSVAHFWPSSEYRVKVKNVVKYIPVGFDSDTKFHHVNGVYSLVPTYIKSVDSDYRDKGYAKNGILKIETDPETGKLISVEIFNG